jgi:cytochrome c oxidase assembly protein subunit 15
VRGEERNFTLLRNLSRFWVGLVIVQITLGGWTILSNKAADIATAHVAFGAITFATGVVISALLIRWQELGRQSQPLSTRRQLAEATV